MFSSKWQSSLSEKVLSDTNSDINGSDADSQHGKTSAESDSLIEHGLAKVSPSKYGAGLELARSQRSATFWRFSAICFAILSLLSLISRKVDKETGFSSLGYDTDLGPAKEAIELELVKFTGAPTYTENGSEYIPNPSSIDYIGEPSDAVDYNWDKLTWGRYFRVTEEEAKEYWPNDYTEFWSDQFGGYWIGLDMFHTLHCLNELRKALHPDYYRRQDLMHQGHCIEQIRQYVMCAGDITPNPTRYIPTLERNYVDSDVVHTCRNFDKIASWMQNRFNGSTAVPPAENRPGKLSQR